MAALFFLVVLGLCAPTFAQELMIAKINTTHVIHEISDKFVSAALDQMLLNDTPQFQTWDFNSPRLLTLLKGFAPAYLRFGGTPADWSVYSDAPTSMTKKFNTKPTLLTISSKQWESMLRLTKKAGIRFLYDFNLQLRYGTQWDPSNTIAAIEHIRSKGLGDNLDFELGNEPGQYHPKDGRITLSGTQIGKDYLLLKKVMDDYPVFQNSVLVGPESVSGILNPTGAKLVQDFVEAAGSAITAMTFHHYYFYGPTATVHDFVNPKYFSNLEVGIRKAFAIVKNTSYPNTAVWIGETSNCWGSGAPNISNKFVDGFLWLEKLGLSAQMGIEVVVRQTFYGYDYNLISNDLYPNPTYWLCYVFKQLVGTKVLMVKEINTSTDLVRVYAHCANTRSGKYKPGAVTMYALSVSLNETSTIYFPQDLGNTVDLYVLTPGGPRGQVTDDYMALNGQRLMMIDDHTMPSINPVSQQFTSYIEIAPLTFGFWVFPDAKATACV